MIWQFTPYTVPLLLTSALLAGLAVSAWRHRPAPGAAATAVLLAAVAWWTFAYAMELTSKDIASKLLWSKAMYFGIVLVPLSWLAMTWQYARRGRPPRRGLLALLLAIPGLVLIGVLTNELHALIWQRVQLLNAGGFVLLQVIHGPLFWVWWLYVVAVLIGGALLLVTPFRTGPEPYRRQILLLWLAASIPWIANLLYVTGLGPFPHLDLTPFAFAISAIIAAGAILRYGLLDIWPYARELTFASMEDAVIVVNLDGFVVQANPAASSLLGVETAGLIGRPAHEVLPESLQKIFEPGTGFSMSQVLAGANLEARWIEARPSPVRDGSGQTIGSLLLMRDVTEQKQSDQARQEIEAQRVAEMAALFETSLAINRHESLAELLPVIVERAANLLKVSSGSLYLVRPDKHSLELVIAYNLPGSFVGTILEYGEGISGTVAQVREAMMVPDHITWNRRATVFENAPFHRVLAVPLHVGDEIQGVLNIVDTQRTGDFKQDEVRLAQLFAEQAAIAIEKTRLLEVEQEQRRMAEALRDVATALNASLDYDHLLDLLLEQIERVIPYDVATVMLVDGGGARVVRTRGLERYGADAGAEVLAFNFDLATTANLRTMAETGRPLIISDVASDPNWIPGPASKHIGSWAGAPILIQGEVVAFYSLDHEQAGFYRPEHAGRLATFAGQAGAAIANARLYGERNEALKAREKLLQSVSHELRTPLAIVLGYAELLRDQTALDDTLSRQGLGIIMEQAAQLKHLVDQLIAFQELDRRSLRPVVIPVANWLGHHRLAWTPLLAQRHQHLHIDIKTDVGSIRGDQRYLDQVLAHLIENASKFSPVGTQIRLESWRLEHDAGSGAANVVAIAVRDQGAGITADQLPLVFKSFYQVEEGATPRASGLGLGLAVAQGIVALHGGRIWAESPGKDMGSTFIFTLPACD